MKYLFIVNPKAGGGDKTELVRSQAVALLEDFEIYVTKFAKDATEEVRRRGESGEEYRIFSCGGDGTFNECVNGAAGFPNLAVAPYPTGTGNDFCRMFGEEAELFRNLEALIAGTVHPIDLIDCNGMKSANLCSVGIDARVGCNVHKYSGIPIIGGAGGYVISLIVEVFKGICTPMKITSGSYSRDAETALACVCNGRFYGGGFMPSKDAMPDDGELDIYIAHKMNLLNLAMNLGKYMKGRSDECPQYIDHIKGTEITIEFDKESVVNVDGEALYADKAVMRLERGALNLLVPKGSRFFG